MARHSLPSDHNPMRPYRSNRRSKHMTGAFRFSFIAAAGLMLSAESFGQYQPWNNPGRAPTASRQEPAAAAPAARRDRTGSRDAGTSGLSGSGYPTPPLEPWGE